MTWVVVTFYKFVRLEDYQDKQKPLLEFTEQNQIKGTILLAKEGINATVAGSRTAIDRLLANLRQDPRLSDLTTKESSATEMPFARMKVKLKREIVTLGVPEVDPTEQAGTYVAPQEWNHLISDPDVLVLDTRNSYEVAIGTFKGAIDPQTRSFRQFPAYIQQHLDPQQHPKVAMFCTGGIRCEKASALLLKQGFKEVYHLQGGILSYLEQVPPEESLWEGDCFVFDERVALRHGLAEGDYAPCLGCGHPLSDEDLRSPFYEAGISCPHCHESLTPQKRQRQQERWRQLQQKAE